MKHESSTNIFKKRAYAPLNQTNFYINGSKILFSTGLMRRKGKRERDQTKHDARNKFWVIILIRCRTCQNIDIE